MIKDVSRKLLQKKLIQENSKIVTNQSSLALKMLEPIKQIKSNVERKL